MFCFPPGIQVLPTCATHNPAEFHISFRRRPKASMTFQIYMSCPRSLSDLNSSIFCLTARTSALPSFSSTNTLSVFVHHLMRFALAILDMFSSYIKVEHCFLTSFRVPPNDHIIKNSSLTSYLRWQSLSHVCLYLT